MPLTPIGDLLIAIKADVDDFHKGMATTRESMAMVQDTAANLGRTMRRVGAVMTGMGAIAGAAVGVLVNEARRLNKGFREINTLLESGKRAQTEFADAARRISEQFAVQGGQLQVIKGLYQTISASITGTAEATKFMEQAAMTASVGLTDMETSVDVLSTALNAYGMEANQVTRVSNLLFGTVQKGKVRFEELARAIGPLIAFAAQFGVQLEEVAAGMALLTRQGFSARRASRALRSAIRQFMRPSQKMIKVLTEVADEHVNMSKEAENALNTFKSERAELKSLQGRMSSVKSEIQNLKDTKRGLNQQIEQNKRRIEEITSLSREERTTIAQLEAQVESLNERRQELRRSMSELGDQIDANKAKIEEITGLTLQEKFAVAELNAEIDRLNRKRSTVQRKMENISAQIDNNKEQIRDITELTKSERMAVIDLESRVASLTREKRELESQLSNVQDQMEANKEKIEEIKESTQLSAEEQEKWNRQLEEAKARIEALTSENDQFNRSIEENRIKMDEIKAVTREEAAEVRQLKWDIEAATRTLRGMSEEMDNLTDSMRKNRIKIKEIRVRARKEGRELTEAEKQQIEELKTANEELDLQQMKLEDSMDSVRDKRRQAKNEVKDLTELNQQEFKTVKKLADENQRLQRQVDKNNMSLKQWREQKEEAMQRLEEGKPLTQEQKEAIRRLEQENERLSEREEALQDKIEGTSDARDKARRKIEQIKSLTAEEKRRVAELRAENEKLRDQREGLSETLDKLTRKRDQAQQKIEDIKSMSVEEKKAVARLREENKRLEKQRDELGAKLDAVTRKRDKAKEKIEEIKSLTAEEKMEVARLKDENKRLQNRVDKVDQKLGELRRTKSKLNEQIQSQKQRVREAKNTWDNYASQVAQTMLQQHGLAGALQIMAQAADRLGIPLEEVFNNQRALQAIYPILNNDMKEYNELLRFMQQGGADVAKIFEERVQPSLGFKLRQALNKLRNLLAEIGKAFLKEVIPIVEDAVTVIELLTLKWRKLSDSTQSAIARFTVLAAGIMLVVGPALILAGVLVSLVATLGAGGILGVTAAVVASMALLGAAFNDLKEGGNNVDRVLSRTVKTIKGFINAVREVWKEVSENLIPAVRNLAVAIGEVIADIMDIVTAFGSASDGANLLVEGLKFLVRILSGVINLVANFISNNSQLIATLTVVIGAIASMSAAFSAILGIIATISGAIASLAATLQLLTVIGFVVGSLMLPQIIAALAILGTLAAAVVAYKSNFLGFRDAVQAAFGAIKKAIVGTIGFVTNYLLPLFVKTFRNAFGPHLRAAKAELNRIMNAVNGSIETILPVLRWVSQQINGMVQFTMGLWNQWKDEIMTIVKFVTNAIVSQIGWLIDGILTMARAWYNIFTGDPIQALKILWNFLKRTFNGIMNFINSWGPKITNIFEGIGRKIISLGQKMVSGFVNALSKLPQLILSVITSTLTGSFNWISANGVRLFMKAGSLILNALVNAFLNLYDRIIGGSIIPRLFRDVFNFIANNAAPMIIGAVENLASALIGSVRRGFTLVFTTTKNITLKWVNFIQDKFSGIKNWVENLFKRLFNDIKRRLRRWIRNFKNEVKSWDEWLKSKFRNLKEKIVSIVRELFRKVRQALKAWVRKFKNILGNWKNAVEDIFKEIVSSVASFIRGVGKRRVVRAFEALGRGIKNALKNAAQSAITAFNNVMPNRIKIPEMTIGGDKVKLPEVKVPGTDKSFGGQTFKVPEINLGGDFINIPSLQRGGIVTGPTLAMVGEAGPEAVMPLPKIEELIRSVSRLTTFQKMAGMPRPMPTTGQRKKEVVFEEGAFLIEEGAFQGLSDEEVVDEVEREMESQFQRIIDELRGSGR